MAHGFGKCVPEVKYPEVEVQLSGQDGNAFMIVGRVSSALKAAGVPSSEREAFSNEAFNSGSYAELLQVVMRTVTVA